jgi:hypothetical protein
MVEYRTAVPDLIKFFMAEYRAALPDLLQNFMVNLS